MCLYVFCFSLFPMVVSVEDGGRLKQNVSRRPRADISEMKRRLPPGPFIKSRVHMRVTTEMDCFKHPRKHPRKQSVWRRPRQPTAATYCGGNGNECGGRRRRRLRRHGVATRRDVVVAGSRRLRSCRGRGWLAGAVAVGWLRARALVSRSQFRTAMRSSKMDGGSVA